MYDRDIIRRQFGTDLRCDALSEWERYVAAKEDGSLTCEKGCNCSAVAPTFTYATDACDKGNFSSEIVEWHVELRWE